VILALAEAINTASRASELPMRWRFRRLLLAIEHFNAVDLLALPLRIAASEWNGSIQGFRSLKIIADEDSSTGTRASATGATRQNSRGLRLSPAELLLGPVRLIRKLTWR
jgi:hypothetical protein